MFIHLTGEATKTEVKQAASGYTGVRQRCGASLPSTQPLGGPANEKPGRKALPAHVYSRR